MGHPTRAPCELLDLLRDGTKSDPDRVDLVACCQVARLLLQPCNRVAQPTKNGVIGRCLVERLDPLQQPVDGRLQAPFQLDDRRIRSVESRPQLTK